ncbi:hypothetical protein RV134_370007 [Roseovarius sp. EC-HK134]|nr:hypothetical protein RV134_370007 [Roseovarius sp. EC-HK134]VVT32897.1 hypothetical protein RV420_460016 [Roseovarius sp. EC-SD190]
MGQPGLHLFKILIYNNYFRDIANHVRTKVAVS